MNKKYYYIVFMAILSVYIITLASTITATGDSSEMIIAPYVLGIAHPPGYPLYTLLGKLFTFLPLVSIAYRINIMSAIFSVLALILFYKILLKLIKSEVVSIFSTVFLAFVSTFWEYSIVAEVFGLNNFFVCLLVYILMIWDETRKEKFFYLFSFILGLSLSHHLSVIFLFPAFLYLLYKNRFSLKINPIKAMALFSLGLLPYIYLPIAASLRPLLNWDDPVNLSNFIHMVTRADYGKTSFHVEHLFDLNNGQVWVYLRSLIKHFTIIGFLIGLSGIYFAYKNLKKYFYFLVVAFVFSGLFFVCFLGHTSDKIVLHVLQRLYLVSFLIFAIFFGVGILHIFKYVYPVLIILLIVFIGLNYRINKSDNYLLYDFCGNMIKSYPTNSILIVSGDTLSMGLDYLQMVELVKKDVIVLDQEKLTYTWYVTQKKEQEKNLIIPFEYYDGREHVIKDLVDCNFDSHRIFVTGPREKSLETDYVMLGQGLLRCLYKSNSYIDIEKVKAENDKIWFNFKYRKLETKYYDADSFESEIVVIYAKARFNQGWTYDFYKKYDYAIAEYQHSIKIDTAFASPYKNLGIVYLNEFQKYKETVEVWEKYLKLSPNDPETEKIEFELDKIKTLISNK
ncbi:MAG: DUF2723 domain-containing protein [Candidatus Firestonebacteria bacterium]